MHPPEPLTQCLFALLEEAVATLAKEPWRGEIPKVERPFWRRSQDGYFGFTIALEPDWTYALWGKNRDKIDEFWVGLEKAFIKIS